ncbi:hypothetical protein IAT38_004057 [Cryptococcus sp. DSM 104549]
MASHIPKHRQLPDKENKLFRELLTQYELKQYKKGLKAADTILKKFPNHGETLALKALTLHSSLPDPITASALPKKEEAEAMARLAIKKDLTSHITWHVLGILAKNRKDWDEASRAFAQARKQDPDNIPLIRDSIALHTHTRQFASALATRHHYLLLRPQLRTSWLALMIAHELNGDLEEAIKVYDAYKNVVKDDGSTGPEKSQTLLHVIKLCLRAGHEEYALDKLRQGVRDGVISPRGEISLLKAQILTSLGRQEEALDTYRELLEQNSDNLEYYRGFLKTKGIDVSAPLDDASRAKLLETLSTFAETFPRSAAPRRMALDFAQGDQFRQLAEAYIVKGLERGVPSLFVDIKGVYSDAAKMTAVGEIVEGIISKLEKNATLNDDGSIAPPTVLLWAYYYLALHLSHPLHPNPSHARSLQLLSTALEHTPTLPELYMAKAMVLKRAGDPVGAAHEMEKARLLDGQDRFLNGKAAKYWLRAGEVAKAEELVAMFSKKDLPPAQDLTDLQCLWFLQEEGDAYRRSGNLGMALKRYQAVATVFQDYEDDQYDFHTYCMRRMTLSAYISLMQYEDQLRSHPGYLNGAIAGIEVYLKVHDDPSVTEEKLSPEDEAERKKAAKKAQKAEQKAKKAALASGDKKEEPPLPDEDPNGSKLLKTETPLDDALKLWKPLEQMASSRVEVWTTGYEIFIRKKLYLAALRCLNEGHAISPSDPTLHTQIIHFHLLSSSADLPAPISTVISQSFPALFPAGTSPAEFNSTFLSANSSSPDAIFSAAKANFLIAPEDVAGAAAILAKLASEGVPPNVQIMESALALLESKQGGESKAEELRAAFAKRVELAWVLRSKAEREARKKELEKVEVVEGKADL